MRRLAVLTLLALAAAPFAEGAGHRVAGSGSAPGTSIFATDAYPGFDGLDDLPVSEKKERSWFIWTSADTPAAQLEWAKAQLAAGSVRAARRGFDALVREWPSAPEAAAAQLALADVWADREGDWQEAFDALVYLLDFYPDGDGYGKLVERLYSYANVLVSTRKTFWGLSLRSLRVLRQNYEITVRRAPGAAFVPDALLAIAHLREMDEQWEEAVEVYGGLINRFPGTRQAETAVGLDAAARMWLARRLAYNRPRCLDTLNFLRQAMKDYPEHERIGDFRAWEKELSEWLAEEAYRQAKFYDTRQRTEHATLASWEQYLAEHPDSAHADEVRARIGELRRRAPEAATEAAPAAGENSKEGEVK